MVPLIGPVVGTRGCRQTKKGESDQHDCEEYRPGLSSDRFRRIAPLCKYIASLE